MAGKPTCNEHVVVSGQPADQSILIEAVVLEITRPRTRDAQRFEGWNSVRERGAPERLQPGVAVEPPFAAAPKARGCEVANFEPTKPRLQLGHAEQDDVGATTRLHGMICSQRCTPRSASEKQVAALRQSYLRPLAIDLEFLTNTAQEVKAVLR